MGRLGSSYFQLELQCQQEHQLEPVAKETVVRVTIQGKSSTKEIEDLIAYALSQAPFILSLAPLRLKLVLLLYLLFKKFQYHLKKNHVRLGS
jgi:hypothetical protein